MESCGFSATITSLEGLRTRGRVKGDEPTLSPLLSRTLARLGALLEEKAVSYTTTIEEDATLLASTQQQHMVLLLRFRMAMKTLLFSLLLSTTQGEAAAKQATWRRG